MHLIDTHVHFWRLQRGDYGWITAKRPTLNRDFAPSDFAHNPCIVVQAAPTSSETEYLLNLAKTDQNILGVVGWCDLTAPDVAARLNYMSQRPKLVGIRPMAGVGQGREWIDRPAYQSGFSSLARTNLVLDALALPCHLRAVARIARRHPTLRIVINHAAKPNPTAFGAWNRDMAIFASLSNVYIKLSGLTQQSRSLRHQARVFDTLLRFFGPKRIVWGSDFPVVLETSSPAKWESRSNQLMARLSPSDRASIQARTARNLYSLHKRSKP